jgi:hypothetical protein
MRFFNWVNGVANGQAAGADLAAQLARLNYASIEHQFF